jgi:hypothetical protein
MALTLLGALFLYWRTRDVGTAMPVAKEKEIEADFDAKKKSEAERISGLDQEAVREMLNRRPGGD